MKKGTTVMMIRGDGYAKMGQIGVVAEDRPFSDNDHVVRVQWLTGKNYLHDKKHLKDIGSATNPNMAFLAWKVGKIGRGKK